MVIFRFFLFQVGLLLLLSTAMIPVARAHSDTPITLKDGVLKGLPKEFRPAGFDFEKRELTLKGEKLAMPKVLKKVFTEKVLEDTKNEDERGEWPPRGIAFSASWYHGPSDLPPYLLISVSPEGVDYYYVITVDLEKVVITEAQIFHIDEDGSQIPFPIDLTVPKEKEFKDTKWGDIIGKWRGQGLTVEFTKAQIIFDEVWSEEKKIWKVLNSEKLNLVKVLRDDKSEDSLGYERDGDLLFYWTSRGGGGYLAKFGSKADLNAQRRHENAGDDER